MDESKHLRELPETVSLLTKARTGDGVFVVSPDYTIIYWDERMESLTGILSEEAVGERCFGVVLGECEGGERFCGRDCPVMHLAQAHRPVSSYEMRVSTRSGRNRWISVSTLVLETQEGPYVVHLLRDSQGVHDTLEMARGLIRLASKEEAGSPRDKDVPALTPRQLEVLNLLSEGKSVKEMGEVLYLSEATIRNHVRSLLQAVGAHSQIEVLAKAREMGLLSS